MNFVLAGLQSPGNFRIIALVIALSRILAVLNLARISITFKDSPLIK